MNKATCILLAFAATVPLSACLSLRKNQDPQDVEDPPDEAEEMLLGFYADPKHPNAKRDLDLEDWLEDKVLVTGQDSPTAQEWEIVGDYNKEENTINVDFSSRGGPKDMAGKVEKDGVHWADGNLWTKTGAFPKLKVKASQDPQDVEEPPDEAEEMLLGFYADPKHPNGKRDLDLEDWLEDQVLVTGQDSPNAKEWEIVGQYNKEENTINVDFSSRGGPKDMAGKVKKDGVHWADGNVWTKTGEFPK